MADFEHMGKDLPGDWKVIKHIEQRERYSEENGFEEDCHIFQEVQSERFNVVLRGSWSWIMQKITSYMLSAKQG